MPNLFISHPELSEQQIKIFEHRFGNAAIVKRDSAFWTLNESVEEVLTAQLRHMAELANTDVAVIPEQRTLKDFKLAAFDMDSTLITIECIDEIADYIGKKSEVAAITEAAMRGEITDYKDSLRRRVALLKGLPETALEKVYEERLRLTPGAETLISFLQKHGVKILLVSGGFTFFTERLKAKLNLDFARSNQLEVLNGKLTGNLVGDIVDADAKRDIVLATCEQIDCTSKSVIAVGDGANDLKMMGIAGVSVAYKAKPVVQRQATHAINHGGLDAMIPWICNSLNW
jgi:phosphoserine phosphatase